MECCIYNGDVLLVINLYGRCPVGDAGNLTAKLFCTYVNAYAALTLDAALSYLIFNNIACTK